MNALRRIFGLGPAAMPKRPDHIEYMTDNGSTRLRYVEDTTASAIAARHNFSMIYGAANLPANFGMRGVIEVKQNDGVWTPVSGTSAFVPDMESQMAALQAYKETGIIGAQPVNAQGTLAGPGGTDGEATGAAGGGGGGAASAAAATRSMPFAICRQTPARCGAMRLRGWETPSAPLSSRFSMRI